MGSLQRSSSLGRAGESSLQTAARALQQREREQKLKNSPYGQPLLKSRSDPAAIRKQRYATSSSEIGRGVARQQQSKAKKHRQRMDDEAFARQVFLNQADEELEALKRDEALARELAKRDMTPPKSRELTPPRASHKALSLARRADVLRPKSARRRTPSRRLGP